ncbi:hypothetical protein [Providencia manganoxydans]|uniref:hypothetical protein n=1 Tax=Providencia manganoxydans TaxID=2923283 RepID=UPI0032DB48C8
MNTTNRMDMINSTIEFNRLDITYFKNETIKLIREPYDNMEVLQSEILGTIRRAERDIRILNWKMERVDQSSAKYKKYASRLNKTNSVLTELKNTEKEMGIVNLAQIARVNLFRKSMERADESINNIFTEFSNGNISLDKMQSELNNLKDSIIVEVNRLLPYKKVNELIGGKAASGLQEFNEYGAKISALYQDSIASFNERIDKYIEISKFYDNVPEVTASQTQLTEPNIGLEQTDILNQQMSAFESQSDGSITSIDEQIKQSSPVGYCPGKTLRCGINPTCGGGITFA